MLLVLPDESPGVAEGINALPLLQGGNSAVTTLHDLSARLLSGRDFEELLQRSPLIVATTHWLKAQICRLGVPAERAEAVYNGDHPTVEDLEAGLRSILCRPHYRQTIQEAAAERVRAFDWSAQFRHFIHILRRLGGFLHADLAPTAP